MISLTLANIFIPPVYKVYRGYFLSLCLSLCKLFFSVKDFSGTTLLRILKFGTKLDSDELYCVRENQPHMAYRSLYLSIFLSLKQKILSQISQLILENNYMEGSGSATIK